MLSYKIVPILGVLVAMPSNTVNPPGTSNSNQNAPLETIIDHQHPTFTDAKRDPSLRSAYLNFILERISLPEYITSVTYKTLEELPPEARADLEKSPEYMYVDAAIVLADVGKKKTRLPIIVTPYTFTRDTIQTDEEFVASLTGHEFAHVAFLYFGCTQFDVSKLRLDENGFFDVNVLKAITEIDACQNQLKSIVVNGALRQGISMRYFDNTKNDLYDSYLKFWTPTQTNPQVMQELQRSYFSADLCTPQTCIIMPSTTASLPGVFLKDMNGKLYRLPESVIKDFFSQKH